MKAELLDSRFPNLPNRLTTDEIVRRAARRQAERGRMKTQNPTTAATQFKAELWTTVPGPGETREVWAQILGHIAYYCIDQKLPPLTDIVVGKWPGKSGHGIPVDSVKVDEERESVYQCDWFNIYPPSESDFTAAYKKHQNKGGGD